MQCLQGNRQKSIERGGVEVMSKKLKPSTRKPKNKKKTFKKLIKYCKSYIPFIVIALVAVIIATTFQIIGPSKIADITNEIVNGLGGKIDMEAIWSIAIFLSCIYVTAFFLNLTENWIFANITAKITKKMRGEISNKINKLPLGYFHNKSYGDVLSRTTNDVDTIGQTLRQSIGDMVGAATLFIGSLIMMFVTNWIMALVAISTTIFGFASMSFIVKNSQKYFKTQQKELGVINGHIEETYTGHNIVKVYNGSAQSKNTFENTNNKLYINGWKSQFFSGLMMPLMQFVGNFGYVAVCVTGAVLAFNGVIQFGAIVAFMIYIRLFTNPLSQFAQAASTLQMTAAASERVFEFLEEKEMEDESHKLDKLDDVKGNVEFKNVRFGYKQDKIVINNFSANINAGQKIAIVGPTGAGKTTIVNLLMRFYDVSNPSESKDKKSSDILIDGKSIYSVTRENVHDQFCMVLQDTWLFEGTVKENIIYSKSGVSDEDVKNACKAIGLHHIIKALPNGYDTVLNDKTTFSEGEKQLLTIARAIVKDAPLLILDEATSSVDTRTERIVQSAMEKLTKGRTSFVIAHRLSTIKNADLIIVMKEGDIVESGNHIELLQRNGFYAELYNSQFESA